MKIEDVKKLSPEDRFWYWIKERHRVYLRRRAGKPKPWTDDEILQSYFFTNPYRENDKVTVWFRKNVREPLRNDPRVLMATVIFRWFNLIYTGEQLLKYPGNGDFGALDDWNRKAVVSRLSGLRGHGAKIFTGAFMINSPPGKPKLEAICDRIQGVWKEREHLLSRWEDGVTLEGFHEALMTFDGLGGFMAYEIVTDLRHTYLLENAPDIMTWANPGPGCIRGLYRIAGIEIKNKSNATSPPPLPDVQARLQRLLRLSKTKLRGMPPLEMREVEHSLCEYDKYSRALAGDGKLKRRYVGK